MITTPQRLECLRRIHLFRELPDEELSVIAGRMREEQFAPGAQVLRQGVEADRFYVIYAGKVSVNRSKGNPPRELARLVEGDYFGEAALLKNRPHPAAIIAQDETLLLTLGREEYDQLVTQIPALRTRFQAAVSSHRLDERFSFSWLEPGEAVFFVNRRHAVELLRSLAGPVLSLIVPGFLLILYTLTVSPFPLYLAVSLLALACLWIIWRVIDWGNDYYIVTNRRVVFLEKVIGLYDSRQEAPLTSILSVNTETDVTGRMLGFGDVIIRTYVGKITFLNVGNPSQVELLVREYWERTKEVSRRTNIDALKQSIRSKLGLTPAQPRQELAQPAEIPLYKPGPLRILALNLFKLRYEESGSIIYRKHWFVLFRQTWLPGLLFLLVASWLGYNLFSGPLLIGTFEKVLFFFVILTGVWWWYQYVDWSNDIFQVTSDQIFDVDKKPLGRIQKNVAPLDNILSMESRRQGLLQVLFNYGNVYITVGSSTMVFEDVMNPPAVQQDIERRRVARRDRQEQERMLAERDRLAEYFAMYHDSGEEFQAARPDQDAPPGPDGEDIVK